MWDLSGPTSINLRYAGSTIAPCSRIGWGSIMARADWHCLASQRCGRENIQATPLCNWFRRAPLNVCMINKWRPFYASHRFLVSGWMWNGPIFRIFRIYSHFVACLFCSVFTSTHSNEISWRASHNKYTFLIGVFKYYFLLYGLNTFVGLNRTTNLLGMKNNWKHKE